MSRRPETVQAGTRGPGYLRAKGHRVAFIPSAKEVEVTVEGTCVARSRDVVTVEEAGYPARWYVALEDVDMAKLVLEEAQQTFCPFKGLARYYGFRAPDGATVSRVAWEYSQPYKEAETLRDRLAFDESSANVRVEQVD